MKPLETLSQRVGQMIFTGIEGTTLTKETEQLIRDCQVGGIVLFSRNYESPEQLFQLVRDLQKLAHEVSPDWPLFISVDQEGGKVIRLTEPFTQFPEAGCLGIADSHELAYRFGTALGIELSSIGINMNYAPVLDVNTNPDNPIIGMRALSNDPLRAGVLGLALLNGMQDHGVLAVGKHFPGHGDTTQDSHLELPTVDRDKATLEMIELAPFSHSIQNGLKAIMTAHVVYPAWDKKLPATFSERILKKVLRGQLQFDGLLISDDLEMKAIEDQFEFDKLAGMGVFAGLDILMVCNNTDRVRTLHENLMAGVRNQSINPDSVHSTIDRIERIKAALPAFPKKAPNFDDWSEEHSRLAEEMAGFLSS